MTAPLGARASAQAPTRLAAALNAIRAYGEAHRRYFGIPGMTLGVTTPDGFATVLDFGVASREGARPIRPDTLFQVGSISKAMTSAVIHQFAAEGRLRLGDRVSDLLPQIALPTANAIRVQHLLDHVAGLAADAPLFPPGGLWTAYAPGQHWHYSNTGYEILGLLAEHIGQRPLRALLEERVLRPLGMTSSRGAIVAADRHLYAQGYEAEDNTIPFARGAALAPAPWVDVTFGAGCVASTAADMNRFLRSLAGAVAGRGGLGLDAARATAFTHHFVPSDTAGMTYGNGLMQVRNGARTYLHHTGGMVSFSSSFHVDVRSEIGAFATATLSAFAEYRPRLLTRFAVDALTDAAAGRPLAVPPALQTARPNAGSYVGGYVGPTGAFDIRMGNPLTIVTRDGEAPLQFWGGEVFRTTHPTFREFELVFQRAGAAIVGADWGPATFRRQGASAATPRSDPALARLAGRFVDDNPWFGSMRVVERGGRLWLGTDTPLVAIGENLFRVGRESWSPERAAFTDFVDRRPQTLLLSGEKYVRHDV